MKKDLPKSILDYKGETIIDENGKILFFGLNDFLSRIVYGTDCFICGAPRGSKKFNDEHVIPDWILKKYNLHDKTIHLPNHTTFKYGKYKVPCCKDCNEELGRVYETPVSTLLKLTYEEISKAVEEDPKKLFLLFKWLVLIFFKTHLKSGGLNLHLDKRKGTEKMTDAIDWKPMHNLHCIIRSHYTGAKLKSDVLGSIFITPVIQGELIGSFDYCDNNHGKTIFLQLDEFAIICVLDDACGVLNLANHLMQKIKGPLIHFQLRELFAIFSVFNIYLKNRPIFYSEFDPSGKYTIGVTRPVYAELIEDVDYGLEIGKILHHYLQPDFPEVENRAQILNDIKEGKRRYLFNEQMEFVSYANEL